jgi:O-antigen ligase
MARVLPQPLQKNSNFGFVCILLYSIALFIRPQQWQFDPDPFPFARIILIFAFIGYVLGQKPKIMGYQGWLLCGICIVILLSGIRNHDFGGSLIEAQNFIIYSILPFILFSGLVNTQKKQHWIFFVMVVACIVMLHHGLSQKSSPEGVGWSGGSLVEGTRIAFLGFFKDPNDLCMFFVMMLSIVIYLKSLYTNIILRSSLILLFIALIYGIYLTNSRGGVLSLLLLVLAYFYFRFGIIKALVVTLISLPLAYIVLSMFRTIGEGDGSADGRIRAWYGGVEMFKRRPIFGIGKGEFTDEYGKAAHNSYVLMFAELGLLGYCLWFLTIGLTLQFLLKIIHLDKEKYTENKNMLNDIFLAKCMFFSFLAYLSTAFFLSRTYVVFLYVFLGLAFALYHRVKEIDQDINQINIKQVMFKLTVWAVISLIGLSIVIKILVS